MVNRANYRFIRSFLVFTRKFACDEIVLNLVQPMGENMKKYFSALMPSYLAVAKKLEKIWDEDRALLSCKGSKRRFISVIDLPVCCCEKLAPLMGLGEVRILEMKKTEKIPFRFFIF